MANSNEIAQIDQINKALTTLNGTLDQTSAKYLTIVKNINDSQATVKLTVQTQENLTKAQKETADTTAKLDSLGKQLQASEQKLKQTEDERLKTIIQNRIATTEATKAITDKVKAEQAAEGSLVRMRQKLSELTAQYDKTGTRTKEAAKEIDNLSRGIGKAEEATNRHQRGVGGYADQLGKLGDVANKIPGPIEGIISSGEGLITSFKGIAFAEGLVLWPIALIIAAFALLYKAFSSTDSGAVSMAGAFKAVGNIMDILIDRSMSMFKTLWSLVTFDWKGVQENGAKAFGGLGKAIGDVTEAGKKYATAMDDIDDREVAAANRMTKLRVDIETMKNKAAAETGKKKMDLLEQAMNKEIELNGIEKGFLKERNDVENMNLASKMQNDKLTTAQKEAQLAQWLLVDDKELESLKQKDSAFAEFMDKNEGEFQTLQKSKADELNKEAELQTGTRRLQKGLATERKAENDKAVQDAKDAQAKRLENVEIANSQELIKINQLYVDRKITDVQFKAQLEKQEIAFLNAKQALYVKDSKEWVAFEVEKQNASIKVREAILNDIKKHGTLQTSAERAVESGKEKLRADGLKSNKTYLDAQLNQAKDEAKKEDDLEKAKADKKKKIQEAAIQLAFDTMNAVFDINANKLSAELSDLEKKKDKELSNKNLTEAQKANIEAQYLKKENAIKTKQAENDKKQALFNIAMNTAVAAVKGLGEGGPLLMAIYIALGLVQAAVVMAKPLPKYAKGTMNAEREGIFGEAGLEVMFPKGGGAIFADKPTYFEGDRFKGAQIKNSDETKRLVGMVSDRNIVVKNQTDDRLLNEMKEVKKAILQKPIAIYDKDHRMIGQGNSQYQEYYMNRLINRN